MASFQFCTYEAAENIHIQVRLNYTPNKIYIKKSFHVIFKNRTHPFIYILNGVTRKLIVIPQFFRLYEEIIHAL